MCGYPYRDHIFDPSSRSFFFFLGDLVRGTCSRDRSCNESRDGSRDRYPRGWEVIEIPICGDLHQRSSPTLLFRCNVGEDDLKPFMQSSWMILGSCYVGSNFFVFCCVSQLLNMYTYNLPINVYYLIRDIPIVSQDSTPRYRRLS